MKNYFNPKIKEVLEENPETTILELFWAGYWRFFLVIFGIFFVLGFVVAILGA